MSYYGEQDIICPYYVNQNKYALICEGILEETYSFGMNRFNTVTKKKNHVDKYCCSYDFKKCPYAAIMENIYGGNEVKKKSLREQMKQLRQDNEIADRKVEHLLHMIDLKNKEAERLEAQLKASEAFIVILHGMVADDGKVSIPKEKVAEILKELPEIHCKYVGDEIVFLTEK